MHTYISLGFTLFKRQRIVKYFTNMQRVKANDVPISIQQSSSEPVFVWTNTVPLLRSIQIFFNLFSAHAELAPLYCRKNTKQTNQPQKGFLKEIGGPNRDLKHSFKDLNVPYKLHIHVHLGGSINKQGWQH